MRPTVGRMSATRPTVGQILKTKGIFVLEAFSRRLRDARIDLRLDQIAFAALGGVKKNSQVNYEAGRTAPGVDYLLRLEEHGVDIGYVLTGRRVQTGFDINQGFIVELFSKLSDREREAVMLMLMTLAGQSISTEELAAQAREARMTLQSTRLSFKGKEAE